MNMKCLNKINVSARGVPDMYSVKQILNDHI